jgi:sulfatase maturation enzyme AslB (radical SAM superfamily)
MPSKTKCLAPYVGFMHSHRGTSLCCVAKPYTFEGPQIFWQSSLRQKVMQQMDQGLKPNECQYCYMAEENGEPSLRQSYNSSLKGMDPHSNYPVWLDLDWSNFCNLKCFMCEPTRSSTLALEQGVFTETKGVKKAHRLDVEEIYNLTSKHLRKIDLQGGEPSLMEEYHKYLGWLIERGYSKNIELQFTTNLTNIPKRWTEYLSHFRKVSVILSMDAYGKVNSYIRFPSNWDKINENFKSLLGKFDLGIHSTLQATSLFDSAKYFKHVQDMEKMCMDTDGKFAFNIAVIQGGKQPYSIGNAPTKLKQEWITNAKTFRTKNIHVALSIRKLMLTLMEDGNPNKFKNFIAQNDKTRNIKVENYIENFYDYF